MKVIELFNDIANNKKVPNKIKISDCVYYFDINESTYTRFINNDKENPRGLLEDIDLHNAYVWFNLDVEILEDKPKKIELLNYSFAWNTNNRENLDKSFREFSRILVEQDDKLNEVIDTLNSLVEKSDKL